MSPYDRMKVLFYSQISSFIQCLSITEVKDIFIHFSIGSFFDLVPHLTGWKRSDLQ